MNLFFRHKDHPVILRSKNAPLFTGFFEKLNRQYKTDPLIGYRRRLIAGYIVALTISGIILYVKTHFSMLSGNNTPFTFLFTAVLLSGWVGGMGPALLATLIIISYIISITVQGTSTAPALNSISVLRILIFTCEAILASLLLEARIRSNRSLKGKIRQQSVIAEFGQYALASNNLQTVLQRSSELVTETLGVSFCKILELQPGKKSLLLRAGIGWRDGLVGTAIINAGPNSQAGYTLFSERPVIVKDLAQEKRFMSPELLTSHGVVSGMGVVIPGRRAPYGVISVHTSHKRDFTQDDILFLQAIANILATAIDKNTSEMELKASETRFRRLFDSNIIGAFISDFDGRFWDANDAFLSLIGYTREELKAGKIQRDTITPPEYNEASIRAVEALKKDGRSSVYDKEYITKSGQRVPVLIAVSRIDPKQQMCIGFVLNNSQQKELERRKDEFFSIASHELKTPVTTLKVLTQYMSEKISDPEFNAQKYFDKMDRQVNNLTKLINELLDITKINAGKIMLNKELVPIDPYLKEQSDEMVELLDSHPLTIHLESHALVLMDRVRLGEVVTNLITNAAKYSEKSSQIILKSELREAQVIISVKDFGIGINKKHQSQIFDQFFRINEGQKDDTYPGLGMGLFISYEIVKRHNGDMWLESIEGKGSTFYFSIPVVI